MLRSVFDMICSGVARATSSSVSLLGPCSKPGQMEGPLIVILVAALLCTVIPLELSQLVFMVIGAIAYALLQALQPSTKRALGGVGKGERRPGPVGRSSAGPAAAAAAPGGKCPAGGLRAATPGARGGAATPPWRQAAAEAKSRPEVRTPSSMPIAPPSFCHGGWEAEVQELLGQITPTAESDWIVKQLAQLVKQTIRRTIPEVEVVGFASGDLARGKAFGVAVPDVDIIINVNPNVLVSRLQGRLSQGRTTVMKLDSRRLQKSAIRVCTDKLVTQGGFKFRRSAFRGQEPKVTLLAPASLGILDTAVPIDFTVNSLTPLYNAALLTECGQIDARAKALIYLVKRWAKDRGICHAAKGHLPPYLWSLLTIYYLQVGPEEGPILPSLDAFELSSGLMPGTQGPAEARPAKTGGDCGLPEGRCARPGCVQAGVGELFKGFLAFYNRHFDWRNEAVSIRAGRRAPPGLKLPLHIVLHGDGSTTEVGPSVEDPFDPTSNLGSCMTAASIARLHEELRRADGLCSEGSLSRLLEPWIPPDHDHDAGELEGGEPEDGAACPEELAGL